MENPVNQTSQQIIPQSTSETFPPTSKNNLAILIGGIIILFLISGILFRVFTKSTTEQANKQQIQVLSPTQIMRDKKSYVSSSDLKEIKSDKYKFTLQYPSSWSYYPKQQYINTSFSVFPEFNGSMVLIDVSPITVPSQPSIVSLEGFSAANGLQGTTQTTKASEDYLKNWNLTGDYDINITEFKGKQYKYIIKTTYFKNKDTDIFLNDLHKVLSSFKITE